MMRLFYFSFLAIADKFILIVKLINGGVDNVVAQAFDDQKITSIILNTISIYFHHYKSLYFRNLDLFPQ